MAETLPEAAAPGTGQQFKLVDVSTTPSEGGCGCGCGGHGKKEQAAPAASAPESHGGCGCGGHGHQAEAAPAPESHGAVVADMDTVLRKLPRLRHLLTAVVVAVITVREPRTSYRRIPLSVRTNLLFTPCPRSFVMHCCLPRWITCRLVHR